MPIKTIDDAWDGIEDIDADLSQGHVSIQEASAAVNEINDTWKEFADNCEQRLGVDLGRNAVQIFGQDTFDAFGGIKNGAATGISSVTSFFNATDSFKGSWRNPEQARQKLETGLTAISNGIRGFGTTLESVARTSKAIGNIFSGAAGHPILNKLGGVMDTGAGGIGTFGANVTHIGTAFANNGIIGLAGRMTESISRIVNESQQGIVTGGAAPLEKNATNNISQTDKEGSDKKRDKQQEEEEPVENDTLVTKFQGSNGGNGGYAEDFSADMIYEIEVIVDGCPSSQNSCCVINGENYVLSGYSISQELLHPMLLSFSLEKEDKSETQQDVVFANVSQLIGKSLELNVSTIKVSQDDETANPQKAFVFRGMIIDVSASRATASAQSASVTVATWDALLQNVPHCRSFENMTLKEIVDNVLKPYRDIKSNISPRFKEKIPYIVQYDQSDYAFISMLAVRFGEWMYNTGDTFVFGELDVDDSSSVNLEYPGGSLMSYSLHQNMSPFSFNHLLLDHYQYGKEKSIQKASAQGLVEGKVNDWTDKAYNASIQRFQDEQGITLKAGGFDSGKDSEGADDILDYSLKIEAQGKLTAIMTVQGFSKLAMLKIGQPFLIRDNVQNKSGESKDVEQKSLKIIGINHSFDYRQEYSNSFMAIPVACNSPSYSDADVFAIAPQQRAKVVDNKDAQKLGRVRVQFPWQEILSKDMKTPWLRIAVPYAGQSKGQQFVPEMGEEVMVGFEMNNAERPYIIGSFYNGGTGKPDETWAVSQEKDGTSNNIKAIRTRNGHTILFNDKGEAGLIEIYDNKNNVYHITLSADDKKITIYSAGEIEVVANTDINIVAKGNIGISADGDVGIKSKGNISMDANKEISIQASKVKVR